MAVFSVNVLICATAYIEADTAEAAADLARDAFANGIDASTSSRSSFGDVAVSGAQFEALEGVNLSPAMTFCGNALLLDKLNPEMFGADDMECVHADDGSAD